MAVIYFSRRGRLVTLANIIAEGVRQVRHEDTSASRETRSRVVKHPSRRARLVRTPPRVLDRGVSRSEPHAKTHADDRSPFSRQSRTLFPHFQVEGADVHVYRIKDPVIGDDAAQFDQGVLDAPIATPEVVLQADCVIVGAPGRQGTLCAEVSYFFNTLTDFQTNGCLLKGKVGSAFTSIGGVGGGYGGHEPILQSVHGFFLQHGMIPVGVPPSPMMEDAPLASPFGTCMTGKDHKDQSAGSRLRSLSEGEVKLAYSQGEWASIITKQLHDDGD